MKKINDYIIANLKHITLGFWICFLLSLYDSSLALFAIAGMWLYWIAKR
tara:strand:- start:981 stop:1127 length:147 start_codon:yes stop_codon:yes gene_type:complete